MESNTETKLNITQTVPFFSVYNMETSLKFYVDGLGFKMVNQWIPKDRILWCFLKRGGGELMLQEFHNENGQPKDLEGKRGIGVSICFICEDALELYLEFLSAGLQPYEPFVGNRLWVTGVTDPDGYRIDFESPTDIDEETKYSEWKK